MTAPGEMLQIGASIVVSALMPAAADAEAGPRGTASREPQDSAGMLARGQYIQHG